MATPVRSTDSNGFFIKDKPEKKISPAAATFDINQAYNNYNSMNRANDLRNQGMSYLKPTEQFTVSFESLQQDPAYQAAMQGAREATKVAEGDISAAMNRRGIMDSTITANAASNAAQREFGRVSRETLPSLIEQAYRRYVDQNNMNRQYGLDLLGMADTYSNEYQRSLDNARADAGITGMFMTPEQRATVEQLLNLKREAEQPGLTSEQLANYRSQGDELRNRLLMMGVNPSFIAADVTSGQAAQNIPSAFATMDARNQQFNQNMAQQQMEYQAARDAISDQRYQQEFDRDNERYGLEFALQKQIQLGNLDVSRMNAATSRMNAQTSRMDADRRQNEYSSSQDAQGIQSQIVGELSQFSSPAEAKEWLNANAGYITQQLGANGLQQMYQMAETLYGRDVDTTAQEQARQQQLREQAIKMAQNDMRWGQANADRNVLIQEYMNLLTGG